MTHLTEYTLMSIKSLFFDYISSESLQNSKTFEEYFVSTLQNAMNSEDAAHSIGEYDIGARWGGEELAVYLPQADLAAGITFANSLAASVRKETVPTVTVSCGVAHWREGRHNTLKRIIRRADKALYNAKESGKNCVIFQEDIEVE